MSTSEAAAAAGTTAAAPEAAEVANKRCGHCYYF